MDAVLIAVLSAIAVMFTVALVNVLCFPVLRRQGAPQITPFVSVLMPARNEEPIIAAALISLLAQDYPDFEVLVLDDDSTDATASIVADVARKDPRIRLLKGAPLEQGWGGKAFACHQLAREAGGEFLLFVDADTRHGNASITAGVHALQRSGADLLSVIPHQHMVTFWEKVLLPLLAFSTFCYLPMLLIRRTKDPRLAMANGQYMLFRRAAYDAIGGHGSVRTALVEDVWLARLVKRKGFVLEVMDGGSEVSCRMYSSLRGIWNGFSKNLFAGFRYSLPAMSAVALFNLVVSVVPPVLAVGIPLTGAPVPAWYPLVLWQLFGLLMIRILLAARFRMDFWPVLLHPVAVLVFVGMTVNSMLWVLRAGGARWKGRTYDFGKGTTAPRSAV